MPTPVTIVASGGIPVTNSTLGAPFTPVADGGIPITLVDDGGMPMALVNEDLSVWADGGSGPASGDGLLLEDNTSFLLLVDGTSYLKLASSS